jgi:hypothetical protein
MESNTWRRRQACATPDILASNLIIKRAADEGLTHQRLFVDKDLTET